MSTLTAPLLVGGAAPSTLGRQDRADTDSKLSRQGRVEASYRIGDTRSLAAAHDEIDLEHVPDHAEQSAGFGGDYVRSFVLGGLDGATSVFSLVAGLGGASVSLGPLLAVALAKLIAVSLSMGFSEFMSSTAEAERAVRVRAREQWETENFLEGEVKEMVELYMQKGVEKQDALTVLTVMSKYKDFFVDHMMVLEHGIMPVDDDDRWAPLKQGFVCWLAFVIFGLVPLLGFIVLYAMHGNTAVYTGKLMGLTYGLTAVTLFIMEAIKAKLSGQERFVRAGFATVFNASLAGGAAFLIGNVLTSFM